jgi:hypothetical protein
MSSAEGKEELGVVEDAQFEDGEYFDVEQVLVMQISLQALLGTSHPTNTFTLQIYMGKSTASALVDTGSDVSFIHPKFAIKTNQTISTVPTVKVVDVGVLDWQPTKGSTRSR